MKIKVGHPIEGISINGYEWLLDKPEEEGGNILWFNTRKDAEKFLFDKGLHPDDLWLYVFKTEDGGDVWEDGSVHYDNTIQAFEGMKIAQRAAEVNGPLIRLFNERWNSHEEKDEDYLDALNRVQIITQEIIDLIKEGKL
jgi:hypothetical protein